MTTLTLPQLIGNWLVTDSGAQSGETNMRLDRQMLEDLEQRRNELPTIRFFHWSKPTVTFGYLLNEKNAAQWAREQGVTEMVRRPTGGGAVLHTESDLSISFVWPRRKNLLPEKSRACYAAIHEILLAGISLYLGGNKNITVIMDPRQRHSGMTALPLCFSEPVCNDIMLGDKKIIGGALRIMRNAILYQGTVQLGDAVDFPELKAAFLKAMAVRLGKKSSSPAPILAN